MALMIREFLDAPVTPTANAPLNLTEGTEFGDDPIDPNSLMVEIEGIHAYPHATRNFTRYMPKALKESIPTWTKPYRRPLILHHNEKDGKIIGRIVDAKYKTGKTLSGTPALVFTANIPGKEAKESVKNGTNTTTSIGVMAHDIRCSICGKPIIDENGCEDGHQRGNVYENPRTGEKEVCYWDIYKMEAKELSYVIVPSDIYSKNINIYPATKSSPKAKPQISEGLDPKFENKQKGDKKMDEQSKELAEAKAALEKQVAELQEAAKKSEASIQELTEAKEKAEAKVKELEEAAKTSEEKSAEMLKLKESLETELAETKKTLRETKIEQMQALREKTGRPALKADVAESRSDDFINDSIIDMKEELSIKNVKPEKKEAELPKAGSVENPSLANQDIEESVQEKPSEKSVDLRGGLKDILNGAFIGRF